MLGMRINHSSSEITKNGKTLILLTANLSSTEVPAYITSVISEAFEKFSEYMQEKTQVMYIRDIPELCVNGDHPYSYCTNSREIVIAIERWGLGLDMMQFTLAVYKELFVMARLQNVGSEGTFGEAVFGEGVGLYFAELMTTFVPPCAKIKVTKKLRRAALLRWDFRFFSYRKWFYEGRRGKWIGSAIGYELAKSLYPEGKTYELKNAITAYPKWHKDSVWELNHAWLYGL
jgi:hypothetical protein